jgi:MYXO-CTERM domain-containing protein
VFATFGADQIVELVPSIDGYQGSVVATLPQGTVAPVAADLAVSPTTFPAPEPPAAGLALAALAALLARARRRQLPR